LTRLQVRLAFVKKGQNPSRLPVRRALEIAQAICERLDGAERDQLKAYAAMLVARHVISRVRARSTASSEGGLIDATRRRKQ
jgi:hypothetical protein